ncbi:3-deoxy-7-phosphoheptulonate synthase [Kiritimatiellaeota bacterium B1221]|nr:3-deoxy-7-phosphoheptulonate synthase [Kiritimatiellaeota bacterium B1221]
MNNITRQVSDLNVLRTEPLPSPAELCVDVPRTEAQAEFVGNSRDEIQDIIFGEDNRFLLIIGPCSIHDPEACKEYARKLKALADEVKDRILVVMRVYFEKPRTSLGWKGLIMDPHLDGTNDIPTGLHMARGILREILDLGLPTATEFLDPITPQYIADLVSWSAIGARTSESQTHRQMASGLSMPLGFKNDTHGDLTPAVNAIKAANGQQTFLGVDQKGLASAVTTKGNPSCHMILRGGNTGPNFSEADVKAAMDLLEKNNLHPSVMVDASHANCGKKQEQMPDVFMEIVRQRAAGNLHLIGSMVESNLVAGAQSFPRPLDELTYGQSITDQCIDWATTEKVVREAYKQIGDV